METSRRGQSAAKEYLKAKGDFQTLVDMKKSLIKALSSLTDLEIKQGLKVRELSENLSPLLSLKGIGVLDNVIGYMDEEALFCMEEAAGSIKCFKAAEAQWSHLTEFNGRRYSEFSPDGGRAFGRDAFFARKMEALASKHYDYDRAPLEGNNNKNLVVKCSGCDEFKFSSLGNLVISNDDGPETVGPVFVRLSLHLPAAEKEHLIWQGYPMIDRPYEHSRLYMEMEDVVKDMNWPELRDFHRWVDKVCPNHEDFYIEPWDVDKEGYASRMKQLLQNVRITIVCNGHLFVASGGYQATDDRGNGEFHRRFRDAHSTNLEIMEAWKFCTQVWIGPRIEGKAQFYLSLLQPDE